MAYGDKPISVLSEIESRIRVKHGVFRGGVEFPINEQGLRDELRGWLMAQGIKPDKVRKAQDQTLMKAFISDSYLDKMRYDIRTGRRDDVYNPARSVDLDALDNSTASNTTPLSSVTAVQDQPVQNYPTPSVQDLFEEKNGVQLPPTISPEQIARAADQVLTARINQARLELAKSIDEKIAKAKLSLTDEAKTQIRELARSEAKQRFDEWLPPKRIEIYNADNDTVRDIGLQHEKFEVLLRAMQAREINGHRLNIWLTGPTGSGKTTAFENAAKALGGNFGRDNTDTIANQGLGIGGKDYDFGADSSLDADFKVMGYNNANGEFQWTTFLKCFANGYPYCADEIDNWQPSAILSLNSALSNGWCSTAAGMINRHKDFCIVACANTWGLGATNEYVGRTKLDAATLDRFMPKIEWNIDEKLEMAIADANGGRNWCEEVQRIRARVIAQGLKIIVSPRATFKGIGLIAAGFSEVEVIDMTIAAGLKPEQRQAIGLVS